MIARIAPLIALWAKVAPVLWPWGEIRRLRNELDSCEYAWLHQQELGR